MEEYENDYPGRKRKSVRKRINMTRGEALSVMGAIAAGVPLLRPNFKDLGMPSLKNGYERDRTQDDKLLAEAAGKLEYLTPADKFIVQRRGNPVLTEIPQEKLPAIGLSRETWRLEVLPDPESNSELTNPLTIERGNAFTWSDLMRLAEKDAVRFLHVLACTNVSKPYGMGLWEGVPLRNVLQEAGLKQNIRRVFYYGYHNDDPAQLFQGSLAISRVLEEAPGELPVILCYKLNGKFLSQANGGPVRLIAPGYYGNRSIKWLQKILVTNNHQANDTYAEGNNDVESPVKTCARFINVPEKVTAGRRFAFTGLVQVGMSGLSKVQYWINPAKKDLPDEDPYLTKGEWYDAIILPPPSKWGSDLPDGKLPDVMQVDRTTGRPHSWPLAYTIVHWAALANLETPGEYDLRCRTIDGNGIAQPLPRPFGRSGNNTIEVARISVVS